MNSRKKDTLVVGASGFIGGRLWKRLGPESCHGTYCHYHDSEETSHLTHLDIQNPSQVEKVIQQLSPRIIFHPAALASVEACQEQPAQCWDINVEGTRSLAKAAKKIGAKVVYFSTDYVFDGKQGPYTEEDDPNPINVYGKAKFAAEQLLKEELESFLIVRVNVVYGWEPRGKNFVMGLRKKLGQGSQIKVPDDQIGNPTYVDDIVDTVIELVDRGETGLFHVAGNHHIDRFTFAVMAAKAFQLDSSLMLPVKTSQLQQMAPRPLIGGLRSDRVRELLGHDLQGPKQGLQRMVEQRGALSV